MPSRVLVCVCTRLHTRMSGCPRACALCVCVCMCACVYVYVSVSVCVSNCIQNRNAFFFSLSFSFIGRIGVHSSDVRMCSSPHNADHLGPENSQIPGRRFSGRTLLGLDCAGHTGPCSSSATTARQPPDNCKTCVFQQSHEQNETDVSPTFTSQQFHDHDATFRSQQFHDQDETVMSPTFTSQQFLDQYETDASPAFTSEQSPAPELATLDRDQTVLSPAVTSLLQPPPPPKLTATSQQSHDHFTACSSPVLSSQRPSTCQQFRDLGIAPLCPGPEHLSTSRQSPYMNGVWPSPTPKLARSSQQSRDHDSACLSPTFISQPHPGHDITVHTPNQPSDEDRVGVFAACTISPMPEQSYEQETHSSPPSRTLHEPPNHDQDLLSAATSRQPSTHDIACAFLPPTLTLRPFPDNDQTTCSPSTAKLSTTSQQLPLQEEVRLPLAPRYVCTFQQSYDHCGRACSPPTTTDPKSHSHLSFQSPILLGKDCVSSSTSFSDCPRRNNTGRRRAYPSSSTPPFQDSTNRVPTSHSVTEAESLQYSALCHSVPPSFKHAPISAEVCSVYAPSVRHQIVETLTADCVYTGAPHYASPPPQPPPLQSPPPSPPLPSFAHSVDHPEVHQASDLSSPETLLRGIPSYAPSPHSFSGLSKHSYTPTLLRSYLNEDSLAYAVHAQDIARTCSQLPQVVQECSEEVLVPLEVSSKRDPREGSLQTTFSNPPEASFSPEQPDRRQPSNGTQSIWSTFTTFGLVPDPASSYQQVSTGGAHDQPEGNCSSLRRDFPALFDVLHYTGKCPAASFPDSPVQSSIACSVPWAQRPQSGMGFHGQVSPINSCAAFRQTCPHPVAWPRIMWNQRTTYCTEGSSPLLCLGEDFQQQMLHHRTDLLHSEIISGTQQMTLPTALFSPPYPVLHLDKGNAQQVLQEGDENNQQVLHGTFTPVTTTVNASDPSAFVNARCSVPAATYNPCQHTGDQNDALNHSLLGQGLTAQTGEFHPGEIAHSMQSPVRPQEPTELHSTATDEVQQVHHKLHETMNKQSDSTESENQHKLRYSSLIVDHPNCVCEHRTSSQSHCFTCKVGEIISTRRRSLRLHHAHSPTTFKATKIQGYKVQGHKIMRKRHGLLCTKAAVPRNNRNSVQINKTQTLGSKSILLQNFGTLTCSLSDSKTLQITSSSSNQNELSNKSSDDDTDCAVHGVLLKHENRELRETTHKQELTCGKELHVLQEEEGNAQRVLRVGEENAKQVPEAGQGDAQLVLEAGEGNAQQVLQKEGNAQWVLQAEEGNAQQMLQVEEGNVQQVLQAGQGDAQWVLQAGEGNAQQVLQEEGNAQWVLQAEEGNVQQVLQAGARNTQHVLKLEEGNAQQVLQVGEENNQQVLQVGEGNLQQVLQMEGNLQQGLCSPIRTEQIRGAEDYTSPVSVDDGSSVSQLRTSAAPEEAVQFLPLAYLPEETHLRPSRTKLQSTYERESSQYFPKTSAEISDQFEASQAERYKLYTLLTSGSFTEIKGQHYAEENQRRCQAQGTVLPNNPPTQVARKEKRVDSETLNMGGYGVVVEQSAYTSFLGLAAEEELRTRRSMNTAASLVQKSIENIQIKCCLAGEEQDRVLSSRHIESRPLSSIDIHQQPSAQRNTQRESPTDGEDHQEPRAQTVDELQAQRPSDQIHLQSVAVGNLQDQLLSTCEIRGQQNQHDEMRLGKSDLSLESPSLKTRPLCQVLQKRYIHGRQPICKALDLDSAKNKASGEGLQGQSPNSDSGNIQIGTSETLKPRELRDSMHAGRNSNQSAVSRAQLQKNYLIVVINKPRSAQASVHHHTLSQGPLSVLPKTAADKSTRQRKRTKTASQPPSEYMAWHQTASVNSSASIIHTNMRRVNNENFSSGDACQQLKSAVSAIYPTPILSTPKRRRVECCRPPAEEMDMATKTLGLTREAAESIGNTRSVDTVQAGSSFPRQSNTVHLEGANALKSHEGPSASERHAKIVRCGESFPGNYDDWCASRGQQSTDGICKPAKAVRSALKRDTYSDYPNQNAPRRARKRGAGRHRQARSVQGQAEADQSSDNTEVIYCSPGSRVLTDTTTATRKKQIQQQQSKVVDDDRQLKKILHLYKDESPSSSEDSTGTRTVVLKSRVKGMNGIRLLSEGEILKKKKGVHTLRKCEKVYVCPI